MAAVHSSAQKQRAEVPLASLRVLTNLLGAYKLTTAPHLQLSGLP